MENLKHYQMILFKELLKILIMLHQFLPKEGNKYCSGYGYVCLLAWSDYWYDEGLFFFVLFFLNQIADKINEFTPKNVLLWL